MTFASAASSIVYSSTRNSPTLNAMSGPIMCLACVY